MCIYYYSFDYFICLLINICLHVKLKRAQMAALTVKTCTHFSDMCKYTTKHCCYLCSCYSAQTMDLYF